MAFDPEKFRKVLEAHPEVYEYIYGDQEPPGLTVGLEVAKAEREAEAAKQELGKYLAEHPAAYEAEFGNDFLRQALIGKAICEGAEYEQVTKVAPKWDIAALVKNQAGLPPVLGREAVHLGGAKA